MNGTRATSPLSIPGPSPTPAVPEGIRRRVARAQLVVGRYLRIAGRRRDAFFLIGDGIVTIAATLLLSRLTGALSLAQAAVTGLGLALLTVAANLILGNYRLAWVTFSLADVRRLAGAVALVTVALAVLGKILAGFGIAAPSPVLAGMTLFLALAAFRGSKRLLVEPVFAATSGKRALLVMSSKHSYFLPNLLRRLSNFHYRIAGIVYPDENQVGNYEQGIQVLGTTDDVAAIVDKYRIDAVIVMLESNPGFSLGDFYAELHRLQRVEVKTMPSLVDVLEDRSDLGALEKLCIHELTGLAPVPIQVNEMRQVFSGRTIMVTGAGGSIGSELCRQLARLDPRGLVLFERDDTNLFYVERELSLAYPRVRILPFLGDITRIPDLERAFEKTRPQVVFHAAAYKHVPILESHPEDAVRVNVLGTHYLTKAALRHNAEALVYISTDKAVNPTSVMGASKRLGEMLAISMNGLRDLRVMAVRFGNVLDSRGSVSTVFRAAIARRQPITVTHRDMKRYFMLTSEAVLLMLQAAALGHGGEVFVLDMGEPVRIWDLAHRMAELAGLTPNVDIPIIESGVRPGEKLFEELLTAEEGTVATENDRIFRARISQSYCYPDLMAELEQLSSVLDQPSPEPVRQALTRLVPSYHPAQGRVQLG